MVPQKGPNNVEAKRQVPSKPTQKGEFVNSSTSQAPTTISIHRPTHMLSPENQSKRYWGYPSAGKNIPHPFDAKKIPRLDGAVIV